MRIIQIITCLFLATAIYGNVRVVPMNPTPEPDNASLRVAYPENQQMLSNGKNVNLNFRVRGFALGTDSYNFQRASQLPNSDLGQSVHIIVDDKPYLAYAGPSIDPLESAGGDFYQRNYRFYLPHKLKDGMHTLRLFLCRSYGESLKNPRAFEAVTIFVKDMKIDRSISLRMPFLTYNMPSPELVYRVGEPILLDFLVSNCELSKDGYRVELTIDDSKVMEISEYRPFYIYGLGKGEHKVRLSLLDTKGSIVPGRFNDVTETIYIH